MTEKEKYLKTTKKKVKNGLKRVHIFVGGDSEGYQTGESLYDELNRMEEAEDLPDPEVLGKYSPKIKFDINMSKCIWRKK